MTLFEKKQIIMLTLLQQKGLQALLNVTAELVGNPLFICDRSLLTLGFSDTPGVEDSGWGIVRITKPEYGTGVREACLKEIIESGALEDTAASDVPVYNRYEFTDYRYIGMRVMDRGTLIGNTTVIEAFRPFTKEDEEILMTFCQAVVFEIKNRGDPQMQEVPYFGLLMSLLEKDTPMGPRELESRAKVLKLSFPANMRVILIRTRNDANSTHQYYLRDLLLREFPESLAIVRKNDIVLIINSDITLARIRSILEMVLGSSHLLVGISQFFHDPLQLRLHYRQARDAIRLSKIMDPERRICLYEDVGFLHLVECAGKQQPPESFCSSYFLELMTYDRENHTSFVEDLTAYLDSGKNIRKAAESLFIHKNSMYYKISRIQEILGIDLEDDGVCFALQFSKKIHDSQLLLNRQAEE